MNDGGEGYRPIQEIISDLSKPVAERHLKTKTLKGNKITFIEWHIAASYLDLYAPGWSWYIKGVFQEAGVTVVHGALAIPCAEGMVERHATGIEEPDVTGYGDAVSNASAMAFKRSCALFGLGRHLYRKD